MSRQLISRRALMLGVTGLAAAGRGNAQSRSNSGRLASSFDIDEFIGSIRTARTSDDAQQSIEAILRRTVERPGQVMHALGNQFEAGIHTLYRGDEVTILNVVWAPMMVLLPHNHNMWASIGIYSGREDNILWDERDGVVTATGAASLSEKQVFSLSSDAIHSVINPIGRLTGAIHIYGGDFFAPGRSEWDAATLRERDFDLDDARTQFSKAAARFEAVP